MNADQSGLRTLELKIPETIESRSESELWKSTG